MCEAHRPPFPFFGGLSGAVALMAWPYRDFGLWALAPPLIDYGCVPYPTIFAFREARRAWRHREKNCVRKLTGESAEKCVEIRLYKGGRLTIDTVIHRPRKLGSFSSVGRWRALENGRGYELGIRDATVSVVEEGGDWRVDRESGWFVEDLSIASLVFHAEDTGRSWQRQTNQRVRW